MQLVYTGLHCDIEIGREAVVTLVNGEPTEVPDELGKTLIAQDPDSYQEYKPKAAAKTKGDA